MGSADAALLERFEQLETLARDLDDVARGGRGRLALISGAAGIGKTALIRAFCAGLPADRVLTGACDALLTPRPLGPFVDIAEQLGGSFAALIDSDASVGDLLAALPGELRRRSCRVLVLEDLHWADEPTLDLLRLLGRRIEALPVLVLASFRHDQLGRAHPLRVVIGELPRERVTRIALPALSLRAVAELATLDGVDPAGLYERTAGNPFFVTEVLASGGALVVPDSVRDAVLARASHLDERPRALLDAVAIVPPRIEMWLLEAIAGDELGELERCLTSGIVRSEAQTIAFRHEIARAVIEETVPPDRALALHRATLAALRDPPHGRPDLARIAHHAERAGDAQAVLAYAPAAGTRAAALGAHREAAAQFARALRFADGLPGERRADLLERLSYERYLTDCMEEAIAARRAALTEHQARGNRLRVGESHRWLSRLAWFSGDGTTALQEGQRAVELLSEGEPSPELAMAYSNMAQLQMNADDVRGTRHWGTRAIALAEELGEMEIVVHSLNNIGTVEATAGLPDGFEKLKRSIALAREAGFDEHIARGHTNLVCVAIEQRDYDLARDHLEAGLNHSRERDLDAWLLYMSGWQSRLQLEQGEWDTAAACAVSVLERRGVAAPSRVTPLVVLGRLRARRGDPEVWAPLDEGLELARSTGELQRLLPVAIARAEARWLAGEPELVGPESDAALEAAVSAGRVWATGELLLWRRRAGMNESISGFSIPEPLRLDLHGEHAGAARTWRQLGCPYEAALSCVHGDAEAAQREGVAELQRLGARRTAAVTARLLREQGLRDLRAGPRAATRANPGGLTARELEVLALLSEGLRNAQIAQRLVLSPKTVDHHVSAILRKLDAGSRGEAVAAAARLGIAAR
jgi:DNA-binding CsgD family transcriptional regulator/tetratricopeptide (TPR) repeat protein